MKTLLLLPLFHLMLSGPVPLASSPSSDAAGTAFLGVGFVLIVLGCFFYLLPTFVAGVRKVESSGGIIVLNLLLGWTLIGWIIALVWAFSAETKGQAALRELAFRNLAGAAPPPIVPRATPTEPSTAVLTGQALGGALRRFSSRPRPAEDDKPLSTTPRDDA